MKKTLTTIIGIVAILLAITACQPKYVIFPFPGGTNTPSGNADNEISTFAALKDALENGADGKYVLKNVPIDPNTDSLPIRVNGNKEFSGTANITDTAASSGATANSIMLFADNTEEKLVIFEIQNAANVKFTNFTATIASTVADKVEAVISVDSGAITANNVSITVEGTSEGTPVTGIALGANATADKVSIVNSATASIDIAEGNGAALDIMDSILKENPDTEINASTQYDVTTSEGLANMLNDTKNARLLKDIDASDITLPTGDADYVIDLNKHKLTISDAENTTLAIDTNLTLRNGTFETTIDGITSVSAVRVLENRTFTLDNVTYDAGPSAIYSYGANSTVTVKNGSKLSATGTYVVATNASVGASNVTMNLSDSTFIAKADDSCPIFLNIDGTINMNNCVVEGGRQAVIVRRGTADIENSQLSTRGAYDKGDYYNSDWGGGNELPYTVIVIGNRYNGNPYDGETNVILTDTTLTVNKGANPLARPIYVSSDNGKTTTVTLEGTSTKYKDNIRSNYWGENTYIGTEKLDAKTN